MIQNKRQGALVNAAWLAMLRLGLRVSFFSLIDLSLQLWLLLIDLSFQLQPIFWDFNL
jgi:hypothetical protein